MRVYPPLSVFSASPVVSLSSAEGEACAREGVPHQHLSETRMESKAQMQPTSSLQRNTANSHTSVHNGSAAPQEKCCNAVAGGLHTLLQLLWCQRPGHHMVEQHSGELVSQRQRISDAQVCRNGARGTAGKARHMSRRAGLQALTWSA